MEFESGLLEGRKVPGAPSTAYYIPNFLSKVLSPMC